MTEHISDEYFVTREVVTYNGSALVSGEKDMENLLSEDEVLLNEQGVIPKRDDVRLSVSEVLTYSRELEERSVLFHRTGGVHCAALVHHGTFLSYKEDISRHVAVDKVVGDCLLRKMSK